MRKVKLSRQGVTLLLFSLAVTAFLIGAFMLFIRFLPHPRSSLPYYLVSVDDIALSSLAVNSDAIPLRTISGVYTKTGILPVADY